MRAFHACAESEKQYQYYDIKSNDDGVTHVKYRDIYIYSDKEDAYRGKQ